MNTAAFKCTLIFTALSLGAACTSSHYLHSKNHGEMFTAEQIKTAHGKVRSGADFPAYIQEIKALGVTHYEAYVTDGHMDYHGGKNHTVAMPARYAPLHIAEMVDVEEFKACLLAHQQGKTDFPTFIQLCAHCGVEKWVIRMDQMSCTYFDLAGKEVLIEGIPE